MTRRRTGPTAKTRALVLARDNHRCVACGTAAPWLGLQLQHRKARAMGGSRDAAVNSSANLLALCCECHRECEERSDEMHAQGYWLFQWEDVSTPVFYFPEAVWYVLDDDGTRSACEAPAVAS